MTWHSMLSVGFLTCQLVLICTDGYTLRRSVSSNGYTLTFTSSKIQRTKDHIKNNHFCFATWLGIFLFETNQPINFYEAQDLCAAELVGGKVGSITSEDEAENFKATAHSVM